MESQFHGVETSSMDLRASIGELDLKSPVMPASGCFGPELAQLSPLARVGAVVTKTIFSSRRSGNPAHRITETSVGVLNSVGIPSPGINAFIQDVLPAYQAIGPPVIVSIGGLAIPEFWAVADALRTADIDAIELNVSCPNLECNGDTISTHPEQVAAVVEGVVMRTSKPVLAKLAPNVGSINEAASAAERSGATGLTIANTFVGLAIDIYRRAPILGNVVGGLSGPGIKPLALRLVNEVYQAVSIPIVGCGGISCARDVIEFLLAGACAVQVGTATFSRPNAMTEIVGELPALLEEIGAPTLRSLVGEMKGNSRGSSRAQSQGESHPRASCNVDASGKPSPEAPLCRP